MEFLANSRVSALVFDIDHTKVFLSSIISPLLIRLFWTSAGLLDVCGGPRFPSITFCFPPCTPQRTCRGHWVWVLIPRILPWTSSSSLLSPSNNLNSLFLSTTCLYHRPSLGQFDWCSSNMLSCCQLWVKRLKYWVMLRSFVASHECARHCKQLGWVVYFGVNFFCCVSNLLCQSK